MGRKPSLVTYYKRVHSPGETLKLEDNKLFFVNWSGATWVPYYSNLSLEQAMTRNALAPIATAEEAAENIPADWRDRCRHLFDKR